MSHNVSEGRRQGKRRTTALRIATEAARLVRYQGMAATTVDQIAEAAEVGRASFFRYFESKERAVAEGFTGVWLSMILDALAASAPGLSAIDAVRQAFSVLADGFAEIRDLTLSQAELSRSSPALSAWTLQVSLGYEDAIACALAHRVPDLEAGDPRPRLVAALVMVAVRLALDDWVASGGREDLPGLIDRNLRSVSVATSAPSVPALATGSSR
jgi:AcrR family transcriptional regulator